MGCPAHLRTAPARSTAPTAPHQSCGGDGQQVKRNASLPTQSRRLCRHVPPVHCTTETECPLSSPKHINLLGHGVRGADDLRRRPADKQVAGFHEPGHIYIYCKVHADAAACCGAPCHACACPHAQVHAPKTQRPSPHTMAACPAGCSRPAQSEDGRRSKHYPAECCKRKWRC